MARLLRRYSLSLQRINRNTPCCHLPPPHAPLPFVGQKRKFIKPFVRELAALPDEGGLTVIDLFGGSGLLSHVAKRVKPEARVVYNDYDHYTDRLARIPQTNALIDRIRTTVGDLPKGQRLPADLRARVLDLIRQEEQAGRLVDYITLSSGLLFSAKYKTDLRGFSAETLYNNLPRTPYDATGYLDGVEVVHEDYRTLFKRHSESIQTLFLVDPPYLSTDCSAYAMPAWRLADYLDVLEVLRGHRFIYFTSSKSGILELCAWMGRHPSVGNPFLDARRTDVGVTLGKGVRYTDIMLTNASA